VLRDRGLQGNGRKIGGRRMKPQIAEERGGKTRIQQKGTKATKRKANKWGQKDGTAERHVFCSEMAA